MCANAASGAVLDGYDRVIEWLASPLGDRVRTSAVATRIRWAPGNVSVEARHPDGRSRPEVVATRGDRRRTARRARKRRSASSARSNSIQTSARSSRRSLASRWALSSGSSAAPDGTVLGVGVVREADRQSRRSIR